VPDVKSRTNRTGSIEAQAATAAQGATAEESRNIKNERTDNGGAAGGAGL